MNISIDDTSPNFVWSTGADDWKGQAPNQVALNSNYFLQTYHATQSKGSNVAITFVGAAIQIYGSKGPNHGNYSVTYDNAIKFFAGFSAQAQYQQLLFSRTFGTNYSETHTVILKNEEDYWLDLDFAVLSIATAVDTSTSDIGFFTNTVQPGTSVPPSATNSPDGSSSSSSSDSSSSAPSIFRTLTFVLAAVLGVLALALLAWYLLCIRRRSGSLTGGGAGRDRKMSTSSSQQEFRYAQKNTPLAAAGAGGGNVQSPAGSGSEGYGRHRLGGGTEDYTRSPTSGSIATDPSRYSRLDASAHLNNNNISSSNVSGAARETLIALNNMGGKRPGYRSLAGGDGDTTGPGSSTASIINIGHDGRETPTSMRTMGSAGQVWLGATRGNNGTEDNARFKGRASRIGGNGNGRTSSYGSDSNLSSRLNRSRGTMSGLEEINDAKEEEGNYRPNGVGLSVYAANIRSESEQQRMMDLKRSASVASSGILDRLERSPPPAVPELPPSATTSTSTFSRAPPPKPPPRSFSPTPTEASTVLEHGGVYSGLGLATKVQFPYGRNNEMLVHSHSGSLNSTSGFSASTTAAVHNTNNNNNTNSHNSFISTTGSLPLRPPPVRAEERERERAQLRERERAEKEREAAAEREKQERQRKERYSRPPPEYVPTPSASEVSMMPIHSATTTTTQGSGANLQRNGTRTGDIPIGIEQGYGNGYESESQDSHSVAHAYVSTAHHVAVSPAQAQQNIFQQHHQSITSQPPQRPGQHAHKSSNGSSNLGLPNSATTGTSSKRAVTPDRAYNPAGSMAVGARSSTKDTGTPAWVGRTSEEKTWGLDGAHGVDKTRSGSNAASALGRPIMDDRTRLAATASGGSPGQTPRRISRVPAPKA